MKEASFCSEMVFGRVTKTRNQSVFDDRQDATVKSKIIVKIRIYVFVFHVFMVQ